MLVFKLFTKELSVSLSRPTIITISTNLVNINQCCLFKQFKCLRKWHCRLALNHLKEWWSQCPVLTLIPVLPHINKSWLKTLIFSSNGFQGPCSGFLKFLAISQNYRLMKIRSTNTNGEFRVPADIKEVCH